MNIPQLENNIKKRTELLTVLLVLSFIGSGLAAFSNLFIILSYDEVQNIFEDYNFDLPELELIFSGGKTFFIGGFVLYMLSLSGAMQMWKLKKIGFHFYTAAQIFILLLPVVMLKSYPFSFIGLFITAAFIYGYYSQTKFME
jgi:hypothetical protein